MKTSEKRPSHQCSESEKLLTAKEAAIFLHVRQDTLAAWRAEHRGPRYTKLDNRTVRYYLIDLQSFLEGTSVLPKPGK